jgi:hypothetical protein
MGADAKVHVLTGQRGELGDPQTGLDRDQEQGVIPAPDPPIAVWCADQGGDLDRGQEGHLGAFEPFRWDGQHALDEFGVLGMT